MSGQFIWAEAKTPFTIKKGEDNLNAQDLEIVPVRPFVVWQAREKTISGIPPAVPGSEPAEPYCSRAIEDTIKKGGNEALALARFFFTNRTAKFVKECGDGSYWSEAVRKDEAFKKHHEELVQAIQDELHFLALNANQSPIQIDPNDLADAKGPLNAFGTHLSFSFTKEPSRYRKGDPLAFGIGDIQGIEIKIASFRGQPDGSFDLTLDYEIWDHFGSDDSDLYDSAQACLYLLQRKVVKGQDKQAFMPFRIKIVVKNVAGSGKVEPPKVGYDWRDRQFVE